MSGNQSAIFFVLMPSASHCDDGISTDAAMLHGDFLNRCDHLTSIEVVPVLPFCPAPSMVGVSAAGSWNELEA